MEEHRVLNNYFQDMGRKLSNYGTYIIIQIILGFVVGLLLGVQIVQAAMTAGSVDVLLAKLLCFKEFNLI